MFTSLLLVAQGHLGWDDQVEFKYGSWPLNFREIWSFQFLFCFKNSHHRTFAPWPDAFLHPAFYKPIKFLKLRVQKKTGTLGFIVCCPIPLTQYWCFPQCPQQIPGISLGLYSFSVYQISFFF
jgi:hypothetical protein